MTLADLSGDGMRSFVQQLDQSAEHWAERYDVDETDIQARVPEEALKADPRKVVEPAYLHTIARRVAQRAMYGRMNGET